MNGAECIFESIRIFENALTSCFTFSQQEERKKLLITTAAALAEKSGYSFWHFSRLFTAVTGFSPKNYISGRIMTECAKTIVQTQTTCALHLVADAAGFTDYVTFSRCFKRMYGLAPRTLRKYGNTDSIKHRLTPRFERIRTIPALLETLSYNGLLAQIEHMDDVHCTGLAFYTNTELPDFTDFWQTFTRKEHFIKTRKTHKRFLQYTAWTPTETDSDESKSSLCSDGEMMILCTRVTEAKEEQNPVFINRLIPGGTFLHVKHADGIETIGKTYEAIYGYYLTQQELRLPYSWEYQLYEQDGSTSIFIPLNIENT